MVSQGFARFARISKWTFARIHKCENYGLSQGLAVALCWWETHILESIEAESASRHQQSGRWYYAYKFHVYIFCIYLHIFLHIFAYIEVNLWGKCIYLHICAYLCIFCPYLCILMLMHILTYISISRHIFSLLCIF